MATTDKDIARDVLRELAQTESVDDEVRLQAASYLFHADADFGVPQDLIDEIATSVAAKLKAEA